MRYISWPDNSGACWENPGGGWFSPPGSDVAAWIRTEQGRNRTIRPAGTILGTGCLLSPWGALSGATPNNIRLLNQLHPLWMQCSLLPSFLTFSKGFHITTNLLTYFSSDDWEIPFENISFGNNSFRNISFGKIYFENICF